MCIDAYGDIAHTYVHVVMVIFCVSVGARLDSLPRLFREAAEMLELVSAGAAQDEDEDGDDNDSLGDAALPKPLEDDALPAPPPDLPPASQEQLARALQLLDSLARDK